MSETALAEAAANYLSRYASSSGNLRRVLTRKVKLSAAHYADEPGPLLAIVDALVARHTATGAIDDRHFSEPQARKLRRRGASARAILQHLDVKGVPKDVIAESAGAFASPEDDREAAILLARRRRLGPFRATSRTEHRQRDLAALGRAGFGYVLAASIIDAPSQEMLEAQQPES